jgi:hypothetical protein
MKTVVDQKICSERRAATSTMHRFDLDNVQFVRDMHAAGVYASISLGVKAPDHATVEIWPPKASARVHHHRSPTATPTACAT